MILDQIQSAPNPQFAREIGANLTGTWDFAWDDDNVGIRDRWYQDAAPFTEKIEVPYPPESELSGLGEKGFHPTVWYRREITDTRTTSESRLYLCFGAVDYHAVVWVDGQFVGEHEGGSVPFSFDISDALSDDDTHTVTVRAYDNPTDLEQPRGKQAWTHDPEIIHYYRTTGIWQPVWLEERPQVHIDTIRWTFDMTRWALDYEVELTAPAPDNALLTIDLENDKLSGIGSTAKVRGRTIAGSIDLRSGIVFHERRQLLWSPQSPTLIGASVTFTADGQPDDTVLSYVGLREVTVTSRGVHINGNFTYLKLVLNQGYWPESHLAAPSPDHLRQEVEHILSLGFNGARNHQKIEDPRFLFWADKLGLLLWGEIGAAFAWSDRAIERHRREWYTELLRDRNHPSVIAWVPFNESWGVDEVGNNERQREAVEAVYHMTRALDGTRPVVGNDGWENVVGDMLTAHDYVWDPAELTRRYGSDNTPNSIIDKYRHGFRRLVVSDADYTDKPVILSEFGGVSFAPEGDEEWFGYGKVRTDDEFVAQYRALTNAAHESTALAGFCYTQLTDTEQETNGLLREDRTAKVDLETLRSITSGDDFREEKRKKAAQAAGTNE